MKKKILAIVLALSMCVSVSACGSTSDGNGNTAGASTGGSAGNTGASNMTAERAQSDFSEAVEKFYGNSSLSYIQNIESRLDTFNKLADPDSYYGEYCISDANYYIGRYCMYDFDLQGAISAFETGDSAGSPLCAYALGRCYMEGKSGEWNYEKAEEYFNKAINAGLVEANYGLGMLSLYGLGTEADTSKAIELFEKALEGSEQGIIADTYAALASIYSSDAFGVDQDLSKSIEYYEKINEMADEYADWLREYRISLNELYRRAGKDTKVDISYPVGNGQEDLGDLSKYSAMVIYENALYFSALSKPVNHFEPKYEFSWGMLKYSCDLGNADAYNAMGDIYYNNHYGYLKAGGIDNLEPDYETAFSYYEKAANAGSTQGMMNLAFAYLNGKGTSKDTNKAIEWFEKAASCGLSRAYIQLGNQYLSNGALGTDIGKACEYYEKAVDAGNYAGYDFLGSIYRTGNGAEPDYTKAMEYLEKGAYFGNTSCMIQIGYMYRDGQGVTQDIDKAFEWFERAGRAGDALGYQSIASCYGNGYAVEQDYQKAYDWHKRAADELSDGLSFNAMGILHDVGKYHYSLQASESEETCFLDAGRSGYAQGYYNLAYLKEKQQRYDEALKYYTIAAEMNDSNALNILGTMYFKGEGVTQDTNMAFGLFMRAANLGNDDAMRNVGVCYSTEGAGTDVDYDKALMWLEKAKEAGNESEDLDQLIETARAGASGN